MDVITDRICVTYGIEDIETKGETAGHQQFLLLSQCFPKSVPPGTLKPGLVWERVQDGSSEDDSPPQKKTMVSTSAVPANSTKMQGNYNPFAEKMMAKMGYKAGTGLGKNAQGRVDIVEASLQRGRRGLGLTIQGLEPSMDADWDEEAEEDELITDETVDWLPSCTESAPKLDVMQEWKIVGEKKRTLDNETNFCSEETLNSVLSCKSIFDRLEPEEMRRARTRSNPYETIRGAFFLNRAAMKMANMDAVLDFMFTNPKYRDGRPMVGHNDLLYFADVCAGPGGFSEYVLWRSKAEAKGFGMTLKGPNDFKLEDFFAGPPEMFEPHYGVGGVGGDGDIFNPNNQKAFIDYVLQHTDGQGVHFVMADGGFSVEGQENIQEILSKQLYLCQFLVAISITRTGGHFVCKLFDLFTKFSVGLVYLMYRIFEHVSIFKPVTSRPANSERYLVCKGLREDKESVRQYFHEINLDLNRLLSATSTEDITDIVPLSYLTNNEAFFEYMCVSNDSIGKLQIRNLKKIRKFTQNTNLYETRQSDVRSTLLEKWKVEDKVRAAPPKSNPKKKAEELLDNEDVGLDHVIENLSAENLRTIKSAYDYRCIVTGDLPKNRFYILGLGRSHVFYQSCHMNGFWRKLEEGLRLELPRDTLIEAEKVIEFKGERSHVFYQSCHMNGFWRKLEEGLRLELPRDTLIEAEKVIEFKGEGTGQRKVTSIHALDALFLFGKDVRHLHFTERMQKLQKFVKAITKDTRSDLAKIVVPEIHKFEDMELIFNRLDMKRVKGGGGGDKLCYCPQTGSESRFYKPTGVYIIRTVKDPWTMQWSRSQSKKYFFNLKNGQSRFDCPVESMASVRDTKFHSYHWSWEEGVKLLDSQPCKEDDSKLSKANVIEYLHRLIPYR